VKRRRPFTLMEVMVVLAIIALITAAGTVSIGRLLSDQRFRSSVASVEELLQIAQDAMLLYGNDVDVIFREVDRGIELELRSVLKQVKPPLSRYFTNHHLPAIHGVAFEGEEEENREGEIELEFYGSGSTMSRGLLFLGNRERGPWSAIPLYGYPHRFLAGKRRELPFREREDERASVVLYPEEIPDAE